MKNKLTTTYNYFSHNLRTCTSTIVATLEALKMEIIEIDSEEMQSVYESSYLIDILDASFSICLNHILEVNDDELNYELNLLNLLHKFLEEQKQLINLSELTVTINDTELTIKKGGFAIKNLLQLILFEAIKNSSEELHINLDDNNNKIIITIPKPKDNPHNIFEIFHEIFNKKGITFNYNKNRYILEF
ncbi:MAG: hypothetical protein K6348_00465 [Deferribacterales bacterium]